MKAERDHEALANRISRLKMEEERLERRIAQTKSRTSQIVSSKDRHHADQEYKDRLRAENDYIVDTHRQHLNQTRKERQDAKATAQSEHAELMQQMVRANKETSMRNTEAIAHSRAAELNHAMYKRNEVRRAEADARERKLREKELMIAHLQQRAGERNVEEERRAENLDAQLAELERQEYELLNMLEGHRVEYEQLELEQPIPAAAAMSAPGRFGLPPVQ